MKRYFISFIILATISIRSMAQCPDLADNTSVLGCSSSPCVLCGTDQFTINVSDPNLPNGTIDWYSSTTSGFDPLTMGTLVGSSSITGSASQGDQCPVIEAIYIDACGASSDEEDNEFVIISSGSGFSINDLALIVPSPGAGNDGNINAGGQCQWTGGNTAIYSGCSSTLISPNATDYIPPNSYVILQTSTFTTHVYDISALCGLADCIYVLKNTCDRNTAAFKNYEAGNSSTRTTTLTLSPSCSNSVTYTVDDPAFIAVGTEGTYILGDGTFGNNGCDNGPTVNPLTTYSFSASTAPFTSNFGQAACNTTQYLVGVLNSSSYEASCCGPQVTGEFSFEISCSEATLILNGNGDLCPGDCVQIDVSLAGGVSPYTLNLSLNLFIPIPITIPSFPFGQQINLCYDTGGPIFDPSTFTINVPSIAGGQSAGLTLNSFTDDGGCTGSVNGGGVNLSFNDAPNINTPPDQFACDLGDGTGLFDLIDIAQVVNGGSGASVLFYLDMAGTIPISNPYISTNTTVYAQIDGNPCDSELVPVNLVVTVNGDAGVVAMYCDGGTATECTICDDDAITGEMITLTIFFEESTTSYDYQVRWTAISGPSSIIAGSGVGSATFTFNIFETTTFEVISVTKSGDCADMTNLGNIVTVHYGLLPQIDPPSNLSGCGSVTLPPITGTIIPSNAAYYSGTLGTGTSYNEGDMITTSGTYYLYAGIDNCEINIPIVITISEPAMIDEPSDVTTCGTYVLPDITGSNINNAAYYTDMDGGGSLILPGTSISTSTTLYLYDANCPGNQPDIEITILPGPFIQNPTDTIACMMYIVDTIVGMDLTGMEDYYDMPQGAGVLISVGDTITTDSTIYIYDNTGGCNVEVAITIHIMQVGYPGLDTVITICEGDDSIYDINTLLAGSGPDTIGYWTDTNNTGLLADSSMVNFSTLSTGSYIFEYSILDSICIDTSAQLTINISNEIDAGSDTFLSLCKDSLGVNIYELLNTTDQSGTFYFMNAANPFPDPTNADFIILNDNTDIYTYIVGDPSSSCGSDTSYLTVIKSIANNAGTDITQTICGDEVVDLTALLSSNVTVGTFYEDTPSGGLTGNTFDTGISGDGVFQIQYATSSSNGCPNDTSLITMVVSSAPNAGNSAANILCDEDQIDLFDYIDGDIGGTFYFNSVALSSSIINYTNEAGTFIYTYIVGDGISCPLDTAVIALNRNPKPNINYTVSNTDLCNLDCTTFRMEDFTGTSSGPLVYYSIIGSDGSSATFLSGIADFPPFVEVDFCIGPGLLQDMNLQPGNTYTLTIDSVIVSLGDCIYIENQSFTINTLSSVIFDLVDTYCEGAELVIGTDVYNSSNPIGSTLLENASVEGCDSVVNVNLTFESEIIININPLLCQDDSILIDGIYYSALNPTGQYTSINIDPNGCDTTFNISVITEQDAMGFLNETICMGDTIFVEGVAFHSSNLQGEVIITNGSQSGCDSIITVDITLVEPVYHFISGSVCENFLTTINGTIYDSNNPAGEEIIENGAKNGCDSIIDINLTFDLPAIDSLFTFTTCDQNYFILIGDEVFNRVNTSGTVIIPAGDGTVCDTVITVELTYGVLLVEYEEIDPGCSSVDSGLVIIHEINGVPPFNLLYSGNNTIAFVLPVSIPLPSGDGVISLTDGGGCTLLIDYQINESLVETAGIYEVDGQIQITGVLPDSISWSPSESLSCNNCLNPIANPEITTTYTAELFFADSCSISLDITVIVIDDTPDYIFPSIFSPNGDGINDNFTLTITEGAEGSPIEVYIWDRWGNLIYRQVNIGDILDKGWDGTYNGSLVVDGVYVYSASILKSDGSLVNKVGDITVMK